MLTIKTDIKNKQWLIYILNEFKHINRAKFQIEVISITQNTNNTNIIYYTNNSIANAISIFNSNKPVPSSEIIYLKDNLYILNNTQTKNFTLNYDLLWNAFVFLTRYEEYLSEQNGKKIHSYSINHPRLDKTTFKIPIVNILFNELENFITRHFNKLVFDTQQKAVIDLSHDVDYITKTIQLRLKQTILNSYNTLKYILKPNLFIEHLKKTIKFTFSNPSYWCFDYWTNLENKYNYKSTFYIYVKNNTKNFKTWLIDPSYNIQTNKILQNKLKQLYNNGFQIGLHGSYSSATNYTLLKKEKMILENILNIPITKTRQHWLNYSETITPNNHSKLFQYDSTLGWNDIIGFRNGCASCFKPYNFETQKAFAHTEIPQIIMDSNVFDYNNNIKDVYKILNYAKFIPKTPYFSISWHQRVNNNDYKWHILYEEILSEYI